MKVLSLFDGMACGMLAMQAAGITVDRYVAFEIDKYAVQTSSHNFPMIEHRGDVFQADFTEFRGFDFLVGGSPCTFWSIAQKNNRETEASGMGWELFSQFDRALNEAQPMYFIYENNKSMSNAIRESITNTFGFEPVCINSALVSAQNRQRLYWVGKRNLDGTYSRVHVDHPEDRGILLQDVLDGIGSKELSGKELDYMVRSTNGRYSDRWAYLQKPGQSDKALCITANVCKGVPYNICAEPVGTTMDGKSYCLTSYYSTGQNAPHTLTKGLGSMAAEPVAEPVATTPDGKAFCLTANYPGAHIPPSWEKSVRSMVVDPLRVGTWPNEAKNQDRHDSQQYRIYSTEGKGVTLCGNGGGLGAKTGLYAIPVEFEGDVPVKAVSLTDGKTYTVYQVKDSQITIKDKQYPIKLADGFYIIRKLTVSECKRLQTVPEWYEFPVSDTQAYKMLGNGWTVEVIAHLINATQAGCLAEEQLDLFKMVGEYT